VAGHFGHALLSADRAADDVTPRGVRQRAEHAIEVGWYVLHWYNHTVV
jgi:hypothetical protein